MPRRLSVTNENQGLSEHRAFLESPLQNVSAKQMQSYSNSIVCRDSLWYTCRVYNLSVVLCALSISCWSSNHPLCITLLWLLRSDFIYWVQNRWPFIFFIVFHCSRNFSEKWRVSGDYVPVIFRPDFRALDILHHIWLRRKVSWKFVSFSLLYQY